MFETWSTIFAQSTVTNIFHELLDLFHSLDAFVGIAYIFIHCQLKGNVHEQLMRQVIFQKRVRVFHRGFQTREN